MNCKYILIGAGILFAPMVSAQAAVLDGTTITAGYYFPDLSTPYDDSIANPVSFVVGAGVESVVSVENVTFFHIDFSDKALSIVFDTNLADPTWLPGEFNGLVFTGEGISRLTGATIGAGTTFSDAVFNLSRVNISGDTLTINLAQINYNTDSQIDLTFQAVPEPGTWAMMIAGFGLIGVAARRRRAPIVA